MILTHAQKVHGSVLYLDAPKVGLERFCFFVLPTSIKVLLRSFPPIIICQSVALLNFRSWPSCTSSSLKFSVLIVKLFFACVHCDFLIYVSVFMLKIVFFLTYWI